ncbi:MAG: hypothetical protein R3A79_12325 [Nannocystaceae bacterium]
MRATRTTLLLSALALAAACQRPAAQPEPPIVEVIVEVELPPDTAAPSAAAVHVVGADTHAPAAAPPPAAARDEAATLRSKTAKPSARPRTAARPTRRRHVPTADDVCVQLMTLAGIAEPRTRTEKWTVCVDEVRGIAAACSAESWAEVSTCVLFAEDLRELAACSRRDLCKLPPDATLEARGPVSEPSAAAQPALAPM